MKTKTDNILEIKGLPCSIDAERYVLGGILRSTENYPVAGAILTADDFSLEKHRRIFKRMGEIFARNEPIDYLTVANELTRYSELESIDGVSYLISLDDGIPEKFHVEAYARIVKDKSILRRVILQAQNQMNRALHQTEPVQDIIQASVDDLMNLAPDPGHSGLVMARDVIENYPGGLNAFLSPHLRPKGIPTGFVKFDELTGGLQPNTLFCLGARPSVGKTAMALNIAVHVAIDGERVVAIFSLEMSRASLLTRMVCAEARVDSHRFSAGYLNDDDRRKLLRASNRIAEAKILIDDSASINVLEIHSKLRKLKSEHGRLDLVIVDYLQLLAPAGAKRENRTQEVSAMSRSLKLLASEYEVPVLMLSQLSRASEQRSGDKRPLLSDLRESGSIEQDCDIVGFIFREEMYTKNRQDIHGLAELILSKQRNGPTGIVKLVFLHSLTKFENRAEDLGDNEDSFDFKQRQGKEE